MVPQITKSVGFYRAAGGNLPLFAILVVKLDIKSGAAFEEIQLGRTHQKTLFLSDTSSDSRLSEGKKP